MELNTVLDRIKGFSGVIGYVIVNKKAEIVHTTLTQEEAISLAAVTIKVCNYLLQLLIDDRGLE